MRTSTVHFRMSLRGQIVNVATCLTMHEAKARVEVTLTDQNDTVLPWVLDRQELAALCRRAAEVVDEPLLQ